MIELVVLNVASAVSAVCVALKPEKRLVEVWKKWLVVYAVILYVAVLRYTV